MVHVQDWSQFFFLVFHSLNHPNTYNCLWNSVFLAFLMFKSEIVKTVEEIGPKVMLVNYFITEVLCSHHLLFIYWSNEVLFHSFRSLQSECLFLWVSNHFTHSILLALLCFSFDLCLPGLLCMFSGFVHLLFWTFLFNRRTNFPLWNK